MVLFFPELLSPFPLAIEVVFFICLFFSGNLAAQIHPYLVSIFSIKLQKLEIFSVLDTWAVNTSHSIGEDGFLNQSTD